MTKQEKLQAIFHLYETENKHVPSRTRDVIAWAVEHHLLSVPPPIDPFAVPAEQMSKALAEEYGHAQRQALQGEPRYSRSKGRQAADVLGHHGLC